MREGNPSGESEPGLAGDLGVSSERTDADLSGIEGTGTTASAQGRTDSDAPTHPEEAGQAHEDDPAKEPGGDLPDEPASPPGQPHDPARNPGHSHG